MTLFIIWIVGVALFGWIFQEYTVGHWDMKIMILLWPLILLWVFGLFAYGTYRWARGFRD
jgi:hypothetical protein